MCIDRLSQTLLHPPALSTLFNPASFCLPVGHGVQPGRGRGPAWQSGLVCHAQHPHLPVLSENGNRYEGYWKRGLKNGSGRFFHLDHGQLFEGFWVDNVAKCGTMIDFGRDEAPEPTQFPIPEVGSSHQGPLAKPERDKIQHPPATPSSAQPSPAQPGNRRGFVFSQGISREAGSTPQGKQHCPPPRLAAAPPRRAAPSKAGSTS